MADDQKFCVTCMYYLRKSPAGKASSGDCTFDPVWSMIKLPTTHWCSRWKSGNQRLNNEMFRSDLPEPKPDNTIQTVISDVLGKAEDKKTLKSIKV